MKNYKIRTINKYNEKGFNNEEIKDEEPAFMQPTIVCYEKEN